MFGDFAPSERMTEEPPSADRVGRAALEFENAARDSANAGFARFQEAERRKEEAAATTTDNPFGSLTPAAFNCPGATTPTLASYDFAPAVPSGRIKCTGRVITQDKMIVVGNYNTITGRECLVNGDYNVVVGKRCVVQGEHNIVSGTESTCRGYHNTCHGRWMCISETAEEPKAP